MDTEPPGRSRQSENDEEGAARWPGASFPQWLRRERIEQALHGGGHCRELLAERGAGLICIHDLHGRVLEVNSAAAHTLGYDPAELREKNLNDLLAGPVRHLLFEYLERVRRHRADQGVMRVVTKDGQERLWAYHNVVCGACPDTVCVLGHAVDVTPVVVPIKSARDQLASVLNHLQVATAMIDGEGRVTFLSQAWSLIFAEPLSSVLGRPWHEVFPFDPEHKRRLAALLSQRAETPQKIPMRVRGADGRLYLMELDVREDPVDGDGRLLFAQGVREVHDLERQPEPRAPFLGLVGRSAVMETVYEQTLALGRVDTTVLIEGETGTGKELVARAIHAASPRRGKPFVPVNCAGLTESVLASQLFGHKRGAFTGAVTDHLGFFETAHGGTLFLDEIGDVPMVVQTHLLRVLETREVTRLGESTPRKVDARILVATHHDLEGAVRAGSFRQDLLYRIRVARISLPPLRERREDVPLLVRSFLDQYLATSGKLVTEVSGGAMHALLEHDWPGNVRELRSAVEFAAIRCQGAVIEAGDLPPELARAAASSLVPAAPPASEAERLLTALRQAGGNRRLAARMLGIGKSTFYRRLAALGIRPD